MYKYTCAYMHVHVHVVAIETGETCSAGSSGLVVGRSY